MSSTLGLLHAIDRLYEDVVVAPEAWNPQAFADWAQEAAADGVTKAEARALRRCLRLATKLRDFWLEGEARVDAPDWRTRVDIALGARAWRPTLELALAGLDADPSEALFEEVQTRFRVVNSEHWLDGMTYEQWCEERGDDA
jgi:hypothetical protein